MNAGINISALASYKFSNEEADQDLSRDQAFSELSSSSIFGHAHNNYSANILTRQMVSLGGLSPYEVIKAKDAAKSELCLEMTDSLKEE